MRTHYFRGVELFNSDKYESAIAEFEQVLKIDPNHEPSIIRVKLAKEKLSQKTPSEKKSIK